MRSEFSTGGLPLSVKAGQVMMCGFMGKDPAAAKALIHDIGVGGIIYFSRNLGSEVEVNTLSAHLQSEAEASPSGWPLLLAIDQEGGPVSRHTTGTPRWPSAMALAAASMGLGDPDVVRRVYFALGRQLVACGINTNFAPVLDVNDNPRNPVIGVRSFGDDPRRVGQLGAMAAKGLAEAGVLAVGKHFPGHGNAGEDSHAVLPVVSRTAEVLEQVELAPFRTAIKEGIGALMTAHVLYPALDAARPATLSGAIINDLLRHRLGFRGLLFTDCMEMSAIAKGVDTVEGAVQALKAGADMVLVSHSEGVQVATYKAILNAAQSGELPISRLDEAVTRIAMVKAELATQNIQPLTPPEREAIHRLRNATYEASVTVVGDTRSILPLAPGVCVHLVAAREDNTQLTARASLGSNLANHAGLEVREVAQREIWGDTHSLGCQNSLAMVLVRGLPSDDEQMHVLRRITELYPRWIVVSLSSPYDLAALLDPDLGVCLYGADPQALGALAKILSGERPAIGRLPVTLKRAKSAMTSS